MEMTDTGRTVFERTYSRTKPDGTKETWPETVRRVVDGNLALVDERHHQHGEREALIELMEEFKILPGGRHLWASGVKGRQYLFNCHVSGWSERLTDHFEFTFLRLMEGGGVGANYSNRHLDQYPLIQHHLQVHIVCDPDHADYPAMEAAGLLSDQYDSDWDGSFEIEDSREGWSDAMVDLIDTHYRPDTVHFKRVYDVSRVRPSGARLKTFGGRASGPLPLARMLHEISGVLGDRCGQRLDAMGAMALDHALAACVVSGGIRRSARMSMLHWKDPQVFEFIDCKADGHSFWSTNISVEVDTEFWTELMNDGELGNKARKVLVRIAKGMAANGEPGFWDSDMSNVGEPNPVICTNPCGEIALMAWENCNLGHVNLAAFALQGREHSELRIGQLARAHRLMARFLIRATYGDVNDHKQARVLDMNRRIGLGHLGVASYLAMMGTRYSDAPKVGWFRHQLHWLAEVVDSEISEYCHQLRIPVPVKSRTVAPTGTIAKMPGVSEGIHPIFSRYFIRRIRFSIHDPDQRTRVAEYARDGFLTENDNNAADTVIVQIPTKDLLVEQVAAIHGEEKAEKLVQSADELTLEEMLEFQAMYQEEWADNAVSFTANVDPGQYDPVDIAETLQQFGGRLKGATIFPEKGFEQAPYTRITKAEYEAATQKDVGDGVDEACSSGACPIR
ncbi:ribonucleoside-triphosphate reductase, adenosylcobalamin-dependent [Rhodococcus sp. 11-3]|uniref:ribonucleoside-triphosphate reductase, adenosylcobalamin-dependent n=1 Tax=Rhodococcus sp. 11-3 TaxID=2854796 RepID=UPI0020412C9E|nr:ribonucleoside-triphosphate reductase, adenosylcobalamin-dependent [Rhodococcus sp. 11-3]USC17000.1 ribonucleoside-triphosphate reductase, adenosylcobalamin-dependent [Rhodococcus sp. 11-3]